MLCDVFHGGDGLAYGAVIWVTLETGKLQTAGSVVIYAWSLISISICENKSFLFPTKIMLIHKL
jgi:hypothetical protein